MDETVQSTSRIGRFERCIIGKDELLLPDNLIEQVNLYEKFIEFIIVHIFHCIL